MLFNSLHFIIYFPIVIISYFMISPKYRWILLLAASYYFYMCWNVKYVFLILTSTIITYFSGYFISKTEITKEKKLYLIISLVSNLLILFIFKYLNFSISIINKINDIYSTNNELSYYKILLPVGISFYTFQALSYSLDIYRGKIKHERHFGIYALYVSFFPQLVAGPIERSEHLLPQFKKSYSLNYMRITDGLKLMLWGYFKKLVVADRLAIVVNNIYNNVESYSGIHYVIATVFFSIQIYCDFSAYSDIAIGAAKIMGFELMDNFKRPYYSKSISEFWKRWHISLSTWFRDYLYIPLGGNRVSKPRYYFNLFVTFLVSGLWHGASWNFIIWGSLHGTYLITSEAVKNIKFLRFKTPCNGANYFIKIYQIIVVNILVCFSWIFFRANSLHDSFYIIKNIASGFSGRLNVVGITTTIVELGISRFDFLVSILSIMILEIFHLIQRHGSIRSMLRSKPIWYRWIVYYFLIFWIIIFGNYGQSEFLYFQF